MSGDNILPDCEIKRLYLYLLISYEYICVKLVGDQTKSGMTQKKMETGDDISENDFHSLWIDVFNMLDGLIEDNKLSEEDKFTIKLADYLYNEYRLTSEFIKELVSALLQNKNVKTAIKNDPFLCKIIENHN